MQAYIYLITDTRNKKRYVGQHRGNNKLYFTGGAIITNFIYKYSLTEAKKIFKREVVVEGNFNQLLLDDLERHYIRLHATRAPYGYNLTDGGAGNKVDSEQVLRDKSERHKKKWKDPVFREKVLSKKDATFAANPQIRIDAGLRRRGFKHKEETKEKIRQKLLGYESSKKGVPHTEVHKQKLKQSWIKRKEKGLMPNMSGLIPKPKKICQYTLDGEFIRIWNSIQEVAGSLGVNGSGISRVANNRDLKQSSGFIWKFPTEEQLKELQ